MMISRTLVASACTVGVLISLGGLAAADGDGRGKVRATPIAASQKPVGRRRQTQKPKTRLPANTSAINPQVSLIDEAGMKRLLTRGTAPQDRPLLVNFWATWCDPCREEFPDLVRIDADYRQKGLDFIAISLDDVADLKTTVPRFLREQHATMPVYLLDVPDPGTIIQMVDPTWQGDLPATFLYDRNGKVAYKQKGPVKPAELRAEIDKLLGGSPVILGRKSL